MNLKDPRTNWKHILIWIIVAFVAGGWMVIYSKSIIKEIDSLTKFPEIEIKKPEKVVKDETVNWKIYRNEKYGYEVRYPNNVIIVEEISITGGPATERSRDIVFIVQNPEYFETGLASNLRIEIPSLTKQESDLLLNEFVSQIAKDFDKKETLKISGKEAIKLTFTRGNINISSYSFLAEDVDVIFLKYNQAMFMMTLSTIEEDKATSEAIFDQMLSTFRFLE